MTLEQKQIMLEQSEWKDGEYGQMVVGCMCSSLYSKETGSIIQCLNERNSEREKSKGRKLETNKD